MTGRWSGRVDPTLDHVSIDTDVSSGQLYAEICSVAPSGGLRRNLNDAEVEELKLVQSLTRADGRLYLNPYSPEPEVRIRFEEKGMNC